MLGITVVLAPVLRELVYRFSPHSFYWTTLMPCRADTLAIGILAAIAWNDKSARAFLSAKSKIIYRVLIFLFCGLPILLKYFPGPESQVTGVLGYSWLALFYVTLLFTVMVDSNGKLARIMRWRWLMKLGGISYCVYLIHIPINEILHASLLRSAPSIASLSGIGVTLLAVVLTLGIAVLSWKYFEEPMVRRFGASVPLRFLRIFFLRHPSHFVAMFSQQPRAECDWESGCFAPSAEKRGVSRGQRNTYSKAP